MNSLLEGNCILSKIETLIIAIIILLRIIRYNLRSSLSSKISSRVSHLANPVTIRVMKKHCVKTEGRHFFVEELIVLEVNKQ